MRILPRLILCVIALWTLLACEEEKHDYVSNTTPKVTPTITTSDVETFISDSGYTRYRITARLWQMFEEAEDPFWSFPDGLYLQQYDNAGRGQATIVCDSAKFYSARGLWQLDGHVVAVNTMADSFLTEQLFWNRNLHRVYSDSFIHVVRADHILEGYGFESDEKMTDYTLNRPTGIIPIERSDRQAAAVEPSDSLAADTTATITGLRPARRK